MSLQSDDGIVVRGRRATAVHSGLQRPYSLNLLKRKGESMVYSIAKSNQLEIIHHLVIIFHEGMPRCSWTRYRQSSSPSPSSDR